VKIVPDNIGRDSIACGDAKRLLDAQREHELRNAARAKMREQEAIECDQQWRASLPKGTAWYDIPAGMSPAEYMTAMERENRPRTRPSDAEWLFAEPGEITGGTYGPGSEWQ
jgi:hypothetical protein